MYYNSSNGVYTFIRSKPKLLQLTEIFQLNQLNLKFKQYDTYSNIILFSSLCII